MKLSKSILFQCWIYFVTCSQFTYVMFFSSSVVFNCEMLMMLLNSMIYSTKSFTLSNKYLFLFSLFDLIPHHFIKSNVHIHASTITRHQTYILTLFEFIHFKSNTILANFKSWFRKRICSTTLQSQFEINTTRNKIIYLNLIQK